MGKTVGTHVSTIMYIHKVDELRLHRKLFLALTSSAWLMLQPQWFSFNAVVYLHLPRCLKRQTDLPPSPNWYSIRWYYVDTHIISMARTFGSSTQIHAIPAKDVTNREGSNSRRMVCGLGKTRYSGDSGVHRFLLAAENRWESGVSVQFLALEGEGV